MRLQPISKTLASVIAFIVVSSPAFCLEVTKPMKALVAKTQSLGLKKFPISFWSYTNMREHGTHMTEAEVASWADAGFTVPQSPSFDVNNKAERAHVGKVLEWADRYGMKLILVDPRCYVKEGKDGKPPADYADGIRAEVKEFAKYPALFGFLVGDEPDAKTKNAFFECCKIQKEVAPQLHPYANLLPFFPGIESQAGTDTWPNYLDEFAKKSNADLISYDCYTQMNPGDSGWQDYFRNLRLYRAAAVRNGIPFWTTILSVGHYNYKCPNQDEIRWQFNTSIAAGANGIVWFFYYMREPEANYRMSPVDEHWEKTQTYYDIRRVQKSFHRRYGDLFNRLVSTRVSLHGKSYGEIEAFTPDDLIEKIEGPALLVGEFADLRGKRYVVLVNNSISDNARSYVTFHKNSRLFSMDWEGHEYEGRAYSSIGLTTDADGRPVHDFFLAPGQEAFYRVETDKLTHAN